MCGLVLVANKKKTTTGKRAFELYSKQKKRGSQGFGVIAIKDGKLRQVLRSQYEGQLKDKLLAIQDDMVLLHHRYPTSTDNTLGTTHPIVVKNDELEHDYMIMHNGVVTNDDALKKKHNELGYVYTTEHVEKTVFEYADGGREVTKTGKMYYNDSEALAIEVARYLDGKCDTIRFCGGAAIFGIKLRKGTNEVLDVFYGQNHGRKLGRKNKKGWMLVASEHGNEVPQMKLYHIDPKTFETTEEHFPIDEDKREAYKLGGYLPQSLDIPSKVTVQGNPLSLRNAYYTREQAIDSGAPLSEFVPSTVTVSRGRNQVMYCPFMFIGQNTQDRPTLDEVLEEESKQQLLWDEQERLEDLAMRHARLTYQGDILTKMNDDKKLSDDIYLRRIEVLDNNRQDLEEEMFSLGFDAGDVNETMDTATQLVHYEYASRGSKKDDSFEDEEDESPRMGFIK